jgi:hypothetical protein
MKHLVIFILFTLSAGLISAQNPEAVIREMTGTVELKSSGSSDWAAAKVGDRIVKDTIISTGFRSAAILTVGNSTITVRPITRLSLVELMNQNETETINVNLNTGRIKVAVNPPTGSKASFTVKTPTVTASVRGTKFNMNTTNLHVEEGSVNYRPVGGTFAKPVIVNAGKESWIDTGTGSVVHPMAAAETVRSLPDLPGRNAAPTANNGARLEGSIIMDITFE